MRIDMPKMASPSNPPLAQPALQALVPLQPAGQPNPAEAFAQLITLIGNTAAQWAAPPVQQAPANSKVLTTREVAERLRVSESKVNSLVRQGILKYIPGLDRPRRFLEQDIQDFLHQPRQAA